MDIRELRVIYSPCYEATNNLIKRWFRLNRMVCRAWVLKNGGVDFHDCWFVDSM